MSTTREGYLRDLPHPSINESLKSNTHSAIKLLKTGKLFVTQYADIRCCTLPSKVVMFLGLMEQNLFIFRMITITSFQPNSWDSLQTRPLPMKRKKRGIIRYSCISK